MAGKLKPLEVARQVTPGKYPDGDGLYLIVASATSRNWSYRYWIKGKERWHGLGSLQDVSLRDARIKRDAARQEVRKRGDRHHSLKVGSMHPPQTQGKVQSAVRWALSGMYLLQASARTGLIDCQITSKVPDEFILPIMTGLER